MQIHSVLHRSSIYKYMIAKHWKWLTRMPAVIRIIGCGKEYPTTSHSIICKRELRIIKIVRRRSSISYVQVQYEDT